MATTSGTYNFQALENDELITECFERIGISGEQLVPVQMNSARRSLNLLLLDWMSKGTNLWTLKSDYLSLNQGQGSYSLSSTVTDIQQVSLRTFTRQLNGIAQSNTANTYDGNGGGDAADAFDDDFNTSCEQDDANGNISYSYSVGGINSPQIINFVGIRSNITGTYNIKIETSNDNVTWTLLLELLERQYLKNDTAWFDIPTPVTALTYRIREIGDATLNIQELYFVNNITDFVMSPVSRDTYYSFSQKFLAGRPSTYYFDKSLLPKLNSEIDPTNEYRMLSPRLNIWNTPANEYKVLWYSYVQIMQDAGGFYNVAAIPSRLYPALCAGLTYMLAVKYNSAAAMECKQEYEQIFAQATANDSENVDITIRTDTSEYNAY